jgi:hypothetical protein
MLSRLPCAPSVVQAPRRSPTRSWCPMRPWPNGSAAPNYRPRAPSCRCGCQPRPNWGTAGFGATRALPDLQRGYTASTGPQVSRSDCPARRSGSPGHCTRPCASTRRPPGSWRSCCSPTPPTSPHRTGRRTGTPSRAGSHPVGPNPDRRRNSPTLGDAATPGGGLLPIAGGDAAVHDEAATASRPTSRKSWRSTGC